MTTGSWDRRPLAAALAAFVGVVGPVLIAIAAATGARSVAGVDEADGLAGWLTLLSFAALVAVSTRPVFQRSTVLATLLGTTQPFPSRPPSRVLLALRWTDVAKATRTLDELHREPWTPETQTKRAALLQVVSALGLRRRDALLLIRDVNDTTLMVEPGDFTDYVHLTRSRTDQRRVVAMWTVATVALVSWASVRVADPNPGTQDLATGGTTTTTIRPIEGSRPAVPQISEPSSRAPETPSSDADADAEPDTSQHDGPTQSTAAPATPSEGPSTTPASEPTLVQVAAASPSEPVASPASIEAGPHGDAAGAAVSSIADPPIAAAAVAGATAREATVRVPLLVPPVASDPATSDDTEPSAPESASPRAIDGPAPSESSPTNDDEPGGASSDTPVDGAHPSSPDEAQPAIDAETREVVSTVLNSDTTNGAERDAISP